MGLFHTRSRTNLRALSPASEPAPAPAPPAPTSSHLAPWDSPPLPSSVGSPDPAHSPTSTPPRSSKRGILRQLSGIFRSSSKKGERGIGHAASPNARPRALSFGSDSSREPSLDIRPPSGLGAFGSVPSSPVPESVLPSSRLDLSVSVTGASPTLADAPVRGRRQPTSSISAWPVPPGHEGFATESEIAHTRLDGGWLAKGKGRAGAFPLADLPPELLARTLDELPPADAARVMPASRALAEAGRASLYRALDLRALARADPARADALLALLVARRDLAVRVRWLALPSGADDAADAALQHCTHLQALVTPALAHVGASTFRLRRLTLLAPAPGLRALWTHLAARPLLTHLCMPQLRLPAGEEIADGDIPPGLLPALREIAGPPTLLQALVPGRPVRAARVYLDAGCSIHQGLKPAALAGALGRSAERVRTLGLRVASAVDGRTVERVLGVLGLELGSGVKNLEVVCDIPEEILFRGLATALARFPNLRFLRLTPAAEDPVPPASRPRTPESPQSFHSTSSRPDATQPASSPPSSPASPSHTFSSAPGTAASSIPSNSSGLTPAHMAALRKWTKHARRLQSVVFAGGAEWRIVRIRAPPNSRAASAVWGRARAHGAGLTLKDSSRAPSTIHEDDGRGRSPAPPVPPMPMPVPEPAPPLPPQSASVGPAVGGAMERQTSGDSAHRSASRMSSIRRKPVPTFSSIASPSSASPTEDARLAEEFVLLPAPPMAMPVPVPAPAPNRPSIELPVRRERPSLKLPTPPPEEPGFVPPATAAERTSPAAQRRRSLLRKRAPPPQADLAPLSPHRRTAAPDIP